MKQARRPLASLRSQAILKSLSRRIVYKSCLAILWMSGVASLAILCASGLVLVMAIVAPFMTMRAFPFDGVLFEGVSLDKIRLALALSIVAWMACDARLMRSHLPWPICAPWRRPLLSLFCFASSGLANFCVRINDKIPGAAPIPGSWDRVAESTSSLFADFLGLAGQSEQTPPTLAGCFQPLAAIPRLAFVWIREIPFVPLSFAVNFPSIALALLCAPLASLEWLALEGFRALRIRAASAPRTTLLSWAKAIANRGASSLKRRSEAYAQELLDDGAPDLARSERAAMESALPVARAPAPPPRL